MIVVPRETPLVMPENNRLGSAELERLRKKINNKDYLYEAIQRIALILSNELLNISQGGIFNEQQRQGRK
jgi:hypothetical protein